ncbi:MAG TPA: M23 family metallopeptidase, partial [Kofleriaceae bacterium]|nr:M23 family metallopeptidase [Kofleriaceae bacterium]
HPGFDLAAPTGTPVSAAAAGTVTHAGPAGTYGNLITVRHANGFETRYAHLSSVDVHVGDQVQVGQEIGKVGTTGYSTGPHLHFEVRHDGATVDPAPLLPLNTSGARTKR